jgi:hypothetical protein
MNSSNLIMLGLGAVLGAVWMVSGATLFGGGVYDPAATATGGFLVFVVFVPVIIAGILIGIMADEPLPNPFLREPGE